MISSCTFTKQLFSTQISYKTFHIQLNIIRVNMASNKSEAYKIIVTFQSYTAFCKYFSHRRVKY